MNGRGKPPLDGIRVLDFTHTLSGSTCTVVLAAMGAEVLKVEHRARAERGESMRVDRMRPWTVSRVAHVFVSTNYNKRGITLDFTRPEAIAIIKKLVGLCQVVAESFPPGRMEKYGIGYKDLKEIKPDIVMISMSGHGSTGPESSYRGYAGIYAALAGLSELVGYSDSPPTDTRSSADFRAGLYGALSVLCALVYWQRTGKGQHIDFSQREANIMAVPDAIMDYTMNGRNQRRAGNRDSIMAPHNCYRCRGHDRWISIAVGNDEEWKALCKVMGDPEWAKDEKFSDPFLRWLNQEELDRLIETWTVNYDCLELMKILQEAGVAAMPSFNTKDLAEDPHLKERKAFSLLEHPKFGKYYVLSPPWRLSDTPVEATKCFPDIGEDNRYVLGELLGMSDEEIEELRERGVI